MNHPGLCVLINVILEVTPAAPLSKVSQIIGNPSQQTTSSYFWILRILENFFNALFHQPHVKYINLTLFFYLTCIQILSEHKLYS